MPKPNPKPRSNSAAVPAQTPSHKASLEHLREQIDRIDQQLVDLLAQRLRVVEQVTAVKQQDDLPTFHPAREENLISARRAQATQAGLDPDYVEDLFRTVLRHSRVGQLNTLSRRSVRPGAKVLIVGGRGKMGRFFTDWFRQSDYEVRILDREDWPQARSLAAGMDLCLLAVPIGVTPSVASQIALHLPPDCVLADITSLKRKPLEAMLEGCAGPVVGPAPVVRPDYRDDGQADRGRQPWPPPGSVPMVAGPTASLGQRARGNPSR